MYKTFLHLCEDKESKREYKKMWKDFSRFKKGKVKFLIFTRYLPSNHSILTTILFKTNVKGLYGYISDMYFDKDNEILGSDILSKYQFKAKKFEEIMHMVEETTHFYSSSKSFFSTNNAKELTKLTPDELSESCKEINDDVYYLR